MLMELTDFWYLVHYIGQQVSVSQSYHTKESERKVHICFFFNQIGKIGPSSMGISETAKLVEVLF